MDDRTVLDRATYKKIKGMTREEMQNFLTSYYNNAIDEVANAAIDLDDLKLALGSVKGIGEKRLDEIMVIIESYLK